MKATLAFLSVFKQSTTSQSSKRIGLFAIPFYRPPGRKPLVHEIIEDEFDDTVDLKTCWSTSPLLKYGVLIYTLVLHTSSLGMEGED